MKLQSTCATLALLTSAAVVAPACTEEYRTASPTVEPRQSAAAAAEAIADTACDREERCGNVGRGRTFASPAECVEDTVMPISHELADPDCDRNGVGNTDLYACLEQISGRNCGNALTAGFWEEMVECGSGKLCLE